MSTGIINFINILQIFICAIHIYMCINVYVYMRIIYVYIYICLCSIYQVFWRDSYHTQICYHTFKILLSTPECTHTYVYMHMYTCACNGWSFTHMYAVYIYIHTHTYIFTCMCIHKNNFNYTQKYPYTLFICFFPLPHIYIHPLKCILSRPSRYVGFFPVIPGFPRSSSASKKWNSLLGPTPYCPPGRRNDILTRLFA